MRRLPGLPVSDLPAVLGGLHAPVTRRAYLSAGLSLMLLKFGMDTGIVLAATGQLLSPLAYLLPTFATRNAVFSALPTWASVVLIAWTLPFAWVGASMSVRRARDAGLHGAVGLLFFVPFVNYLMMATLAAIPSRPGVRSPLLPLRGPDRGLAAALTGVAAGSLTGAVLAPVLVFGAGAYGMALFFGTPLVMGAITGLLYNLGGKRGALATSGLGVLTVGITSGLLLLVAFEGILCLAMASPPAVVMAILGALLGRELAAVDRRALAAPMALLPMLGFVEPQASEPRLRMVQSEVEVQASPEAVWPVVLAFPEIPEHDLAWYFRAGLAWPQRARIEGEGVGAIRHCEFSTGPFVEPITVWDPPHRLGFSVTENPHPMHELSPWESIDAPHLEGFLTSHRGEFELVALPGGGTRLIGRTWYTVEMGPEGYWGLWTDAIIHRIHGRVLGHIATVVEAG